MKVDKAIQSIGLLSSLFNLKSQKGVGPSETDNICLLNDISADCLAAHFGHLHFRA